VCGLGGVFSLSSIAPERVAAISSALRHRGPDDEGFLAFDRYGSYETFRGDDTVAALASQPHWTAASGPYTMALCSRRLAILDLSVAGHQPMVSRDGDLALAFNGEIYNYLELADELESLGWRLRPCGDTAVVVAAFAQWGPTCVERFRGMWALALHDRRSGRLTLSRDRFGIKPLYYARSGDAIVFASEIKGVLAALPGDPRGSASEVVRLLTWGGIDDDETTLFEDVRAVPAGCNLHVAADDLGITPERYYRLASHVADEFDGSLGEAVKEYTSRFSDAIRIHLRSDVRVGTCLSGGLDSSLITAFAMSDLDGAPLRTFSAVYADPAVDERRYIEQHAASNGRMEQRFISPSADQLLEDIDRLVWAQDQPMASSSPYAQWAVMGLAAADGMKVLLDGQGADEAIGGYSYFAGAYLLELARRGRVLETLREGRRLRDRRGIRPYTEIGRVALQRLPATFRRQVRRRMRIGSGLVLPEYRSLARSPSRDSPRSYREYCIDAIERSLPQLLRYEDRSSMAFSIESRVPYLDHPLVEFVLSLPTNMKIRDGWSKLVQRLAATGRVPDEIAWRRDKLGFATPQQTWQRQTAGDMRDFIRQFEIPPFLDRAGIERLIASDLAGVSASEYWQTMFLLRWIHVFRVGFT
jgi:asparagine synthase (glutamine-hydrolysing)